VASKGDIGWKRRDNHGGRMEFKAKKVGDRWLFRVRNRRFDDWREHRAPPLEDWLELLDAVRRRIQRNLIPEIEEEHLIKTIREKYPEAAL
jgi:hypothetical protein